MKVLKSVIDDIWKSYFSLFKGEVPTISCEYCKDYGEEGFYAELEGGEIRLRVGSFSAASFASHQLAIGFLSGHLPEYLGKRVPFFALRPLWFGSSKILRISPKIAVSLPESIVSALKEGKSEEVLDILLSKLFQLGCNAVVFGRRSRESLEEESIKDLNVNVFLSEIRQKGIKVIIKPEVTIAKGKSFADVLYKKDAKYLEEAFEDFFSILGSIDYLFWEGLFSDGKENTVSSFEDLTYLEKAIYEEAFVRKSMNKDLSLIYYLPSSDKSVAREQAGCFENLCNEVGRNTVLSFSFVEGEPFEDHLSPHPIWESLRASHGESSTAFLPIVNVGSIGSGEGLWPILPLDHIESYISYMYRHRFLGAMMMSDHIPQRGSLLDCSLWVGSQVQWMKLSPDLLANTWFLANRSVLGNDWDRLHLKKIRELVLRLKRLCKGTLRPSEFYDAEKELFRLEVESILFYLKFLREKFLKSNVSVKERDDRIISFSDYLCYFIRDAKRMIFSFLQGEEISISNVLDGEDLQKGFWTTLIQGAKGGIGGKASVSLLKRADYEASDGVMDRIYKSARLL